MQHYAIPTRTITETNKLVYTTATVILEMTGYKNTIGHKEHYSPWMRSVEAKIKETRREVSQLSELQKGICGNYNKLFIPEALETAKQRLTALATHLKRYTGEAEARRINWTSPLKHPK